MALITHPTQVSSAALLARPPAWTKEVKWKPFVSFLLIGRREMCISLKHRHCLLSHGGLAILSTKEKPLKVSAFKGSAQNDESEGRANGSKLSKSSVRLSYVQEEREKSIEETPVVQKVPFSNTSEEREETLAGSPAIENLFKKWLVMLRTQTPNHATDNIFKESPGQIEISGCQSQTLQQRANVLLKAVLGYFAGLGAAIKIPLMIFIPWYLTINVVYGAEVSKELTPLWVFGPLIVALYIKMVQGLCSLYVFTFRLAFKLVKKLPAYSLLAYDYIAQGKLRGYLKSYLFQPFIDIRNLNYKEVSKQKLKEVQEWAVEKYLDYVESIWPYYCRTIRFLKKANLI